jgi:hypothetical protein
MTLRRQLKELEELKKQKKFAEKKEEEGRLVLVLRRTGKGPEDYDFLPAKVKNQQPVSQELVSLL